MLYKMEVFQALRFVGRSTESGIAKPAEAKKSGGVP
jgi:hypothetical protein